MRDPLEAGDADVALVTEALPENVAVVRQAAIAAAEVAGLPQHRIEDVALAVGEACANVVVHAYGEARGDIAMFVRESPAELEFVVRDWGSGLAPRPDSPGLGLGLPLIVALADGVQLRAGDGGAHDVRMTFLRDAAPSDPGDAPRELQR
jgi:anti-sigma regulatory factor (Ser/Thr protein kinase)